jgi:hypothetical protein
VEHTRRLMEAGYGGILDEQDGRERVLFRLINGGVSVAACQSFLNHEQIEQNRLLARGLIARQRTGENVHTPPWTSMEQMVRFRQEMTAALATGAEAFRMAQQPARPAHHQPPPLSRLFPQT